MGKLISKIIWETSKWVEAPEAVASSPKKRRRKPEREDSKSKKDDRRQVPQESKERRRTSHRRMLTQSCQPLIQWQNVGSDCSSRKESKIICSWRKNLLRIRSF